MDVKQKSTQRAFIFTLPLSFFIAALSEASEKLTIRVILVQEVGIDTMVWGWIQLKMSQTVLMYGLISYAQTDLEKVKGLLIKIKVIKGFSAKLKVLKDCNQIKGF